MDFMWPWGLVLLVLFLFWRVKEWLYRLDTKKTHEELLARLDDEPLIEGEVKHVETEWYVYTPYWLHQVALRVGFQVGSRRSVEVDSSGVAEWDEEEEDEDDFA